MIFSADADARSTPTSTIALTDTAEASLTPTSGEVLTSSPRAKKFDPNKRKKTKELSP